VPRARGILPPGLNGGTDIRAFLRHFSQEIDMPTKKTQAKKPVRKAKTTAKKPAKASPKKKPAAKKVAAKKTTTKKPVVKKKTPVKKAVSKKAPAKKAVAKKTPAKKVATKKAPAKKAVAKKTPAKKVATKKAPAKKAVAKKAPAAPKSRRKNDKKVARAVGELQRFDDFKPYKPSRGESYMNDEQLEHFKQLLYVWRAELVEEMTRTVSHMKDEAANFPDPADRATQEEFSLELRTRDRERKLIKKIDGTLERIKIDDYGYCDACGIEIGIQRLEARPTATLCIDCKTLAEIKERQELG
jgi:DnaK suppressor protein